MDSVEVSPDRKKLAVAWAGEKAGRLKPNAQLVGYSPLSPLIELEMLSLGIEGKRMLWVALQTVAGEYGLPADRLAELVARARRQRDRVERQRRTLAARALTG
jgi:hypothetical protein